MNNYRGKIQRQNSKNLIKSRENSLLRNRTLNTELFLGLLYFSTNTFPQLSFVNAFPTLSFVWEYKKVPFVLKIAFSTSTALIDWTFVIAYLMLDYSFHQLILVQLLVEITLWPTLWMYCTLDLRI